MKSFWQLFGRGGKQEPKAASQAATPPIPEPEPQSASRPKLIEYSEANLAEMNANRERLRILMNEADLLERACQVDEAMAAYMECLLVPARERFPVGVDQLIDIWMGLGFCHADRRDWTGALGWYHGVEQCLASVAESRASDQQLSGSQAKPEWHEHLPPGFVVVVPRTFDVESAQANTYDSIALALDNSDQLESASEYYQRAASLYAQLGNFARESDIWLHQTHGFGRRQQWAQMATTAEKMRVAAGKAQKRSAELESFRLLGYAMRNLQDWPAMFEFKARAVLLARELKDPGLAQDEEILRRILDVLRPNMVQSGDREITELLVRVATIVDDPDLAQYKVLLQKLQ